MFPTNIFWAYFTTLQDLFSFRAKQMKKVDKKRKLTGHRMHFATLVRFSDVILNQSWLNEIASSFGEVQKTPLNNS